MPKQKGQRYGRHLFLNAVWVVVVGVGALLTILTSLTRRNMLNEFKQLSS